MATITGRSKKFNGKKADYVLIFAWKTGQWLGTSKPDAAGNWTFNYDTNVIVGLTYVADGCEPIAHGPYEFVTNL